MVLWELTLVTAYVLGLKRTYRLALRAQKRLFASKYPRIHDFTQRRTKAVFSVALSMHKEIQRRDISVGRNLGNWLLRMLDRARPQANIRGSSSAHNSQSGPGRPSPGRLESTSTTKEGESKSVQAGRLKASAVETTMSSCMTYSKGPIGSTLRSRITNGLRLRKRTLISPLPALSTFGIWWQPVRRQSGNSFPLTTATFSMRSFEVQGIHPVHVLQSGLFERRQSVFREDIARLMRSSGTRL